MRRLARWSLDALTLLSVALCAATVITWVRSQQTCDTLEWRRKSDGSDSHGKVGYLAIVTLRGRIETIVQVNSAYPIFGPRALSHSTGSARMAGTLGVMPAVTRRGITGQSAPAPFYRVYFNAGPFAYYRRDESTIFHDHVFLFPLALPTALFAALPARAAWRLRSRLRRTPRPGHCADCAYDLTANLSGVCPECGTPVTKGAA